MRVHMFLLRAFNIGLAMQWQKCLHRDLKDDDSDIDLAKPCIAQGSGGGPMEKVQALRKYNHQEFGFCWSKNLYLQLNAHVKLMA